MKVEKRLFPAAMFGRFIENHPQVGNGQWNECSLLETEAAFG
ncbi:hypothetical protein [Paenibacillus mendelii]|uniref:Uncharacterized protein n=1 Tax=Paenibacillus mendelii TaxID=206163 RepID=A0ABV6JEY6_9BACL|nr:hypothetical protein [Paenibacillus mendelii]MCQ6557346.1 hypothetical protein [Paenibacillus mendelii]